MKDLVSGVCSGQIVCAALAQLQLSQGWLPCKLVAVELVAIRLVATWSGGHEWGVCGHGHWDDDHEDGDPQGGGHGTWVGGQGGLMSPSAP